MQSFLVASVLRMELTFERAVFVTVFCFKKITAAVPWVYVHFKTLSLTIVCLLTMDIDDDHSQGIEDENLMEDQGEIVAGNHSEAPNNVDNEESDDLLRKAIIRYNDNSYASYFLRSNLYFAMGYRMSNLRKVELKSTFNVDYETQGLSVGISVQNMTCHGDQIIGIVKPIVKIHLVSLETGLYIKSRKLPPAPPVVTKPCALKDSTMSPSWNQEIILDALYRDVATADSLLLFEILDDKPSLSMPRATASKPALVPTAKRIAWAYLLPVGVDGELNIGMSDDWKTSNRADKNKTKSGVDGRADGTGVHRTLSDDNVNNKRSSGKPDHRSDDKLAGDKKLDFAELPHGSPDRDNSRSHPNTARRNYPWGKRSADLPVRLQLHYYREHDGVFGFLQRKIMGWPALANYTDRCTLTIKLELTALSD